MWLIKAYINSFFLILFCVTIHSQNTTIPDPNFEQALIDLGYDSAPLNGVVPTSNINTIINLDVANKNISDLTGIENFTSLTILNCSKNLLTSLNISNNTKLSQIYCSYNNLAALDVSNLLDLSIFWCDNNQLSTLNITKNTKLISLVCNSNNLTNLDVSKNINLNVFVCKNNQITNLNITKNTKLNRFECGFNLISNLDISKISSLTILTCENNNISFLNTETNNNLITVNCSNNSISELDFSRTNNLTSLDCSSNKLCKLNLKNGNNSKATVNFSNNINLNCVVVDNPLNIPTTWVPNKFLNYVDTQSECNYYVNIDTLNSVITNTSYILPPLTYGRYFTESGGLGTALNAGDIINKSQTIYIYNTSICATKESKFKILIISENYYIPKYFTPNNDGTHDFWKVEDFNNTIKSIAIFNRNGKLLKFLSANSIGWNGTFNGKPLETNDYWYAITLNTGEIIKGHFTLKR
ncbi:T9SS type B sorting domain-containing protein [Mariniflexile sp.]|uniref:T9SS type B sorting domain-containing protein n=1 Tax=Mariniflexile sp. TaxID=1979402 RepID=UPI0035694888